MNRAIKGVFYVVYRQVQVELINSELFAVVVPIYHAYSFIHNFIII